MSNPQAKPPLKSPSPHEQQIIEHSKCLLGECATITNKLPAGSPFKYLMEGFHNGTPPTTDQLLRIVLNSDISVEDFCNFTSPYSIRLAACLLLTEMLKLLFLLVHQIETSRIHVKEIRRKNNSNSKKLVIERCMSLQVRVASCLLELSGPVSN